MKSPFLYALIALLILAVRVNAQEAPPACVGDQCTAAAVDAAVSAPQTSIVVHSTSVNYPVLGAPVRLMGRAVRGVGAVLENGIERRQTRRADRRARISGRIAARRGC
jgi:hypothetical protein